MKAKLKVIKNWEFEEFELTGTSFKYSPTGCKGMIARSEDEIVNHIDGKKTNNRLDNLEWCSRRDNYNHAVEMDLIDPSIPYQLAQNSRFGYYQGSYNGMAKLTENDVIYIRSNYIPKGKGQKCNRQELAAYFGVSVGLISRIVKNEIWTHV